MKLKIRKNKHLKEGRKRTIKENTGSWLGSIFAGSADEEAGIKLCKKMGRTLDYTSQRLMSLTALVDSLEAKLSARGVIQEVATPDVKLKNINNQLG